MKRTVILLLALALVISSTAAPVLAGGNARRPAIVAAGDRVVDLQRTDTGWEGTWYWYVGSTYNATNLTGATALGLLEAYNDTHDEAYLDAAVDAADFIMTHLGAGATGTKHHVRTTAADVVFLHRLADVTGNAGYATRATSEWDNLTTYYPTAGDLDAVFRAIPRRSAWDLAFFMEAAHLSGDDTWAGDAAAILSDTSDSFYYGTDTWWYALNVSGAIRALVGCGYADAYYDEIVWFLSELIAVSDSDDGVGGWVQDTSYAVIAFSTVGGAGHRYANDLSRWLARQQEANGGWLEGGDEYPEIDGEALWALSSTIGTDTTLDGFQTGTPMNSSWIKSVSSAPVAPFAGE